MPQSTWCPLPWMSVFVRSNGDFALCCHAHASPSRGSLFNDEGARIRVADCDIEEARNSKTARDVRAAIMKGEWHEACARCRREEEAGMNSQRLNESRRWEAEIGADEAFSVTAPDGRLDARQSPAWSFDIRTGNQCNLKCRMCGPSQSSAWYKDYTLVDSTIFTDTHGKVILGTDAHGRVTPNTEVYDWFAQPRFWKDMEAYLPQLRHVFFAGGEPLLIRAHFDFLELLVARGLAGGIELEYNTNISVIPPRLSEVWSRFRKVKVGASVDAYGKLNDYIRHPSRWQVIERHLRTFDEMGKNVDVRVMPTVQMYNVLSIHELFKWCLEDRYRRRPDSALHRYIACHPLHAPEFLNIRVLPPRARRRLVELNRDFHVWLEEWMSSHQFAQARREKLRAWADKNLDSYVRYIESADWSARLPEFISYTKRLDEIRGENFREACPELHELILGEV